MSLPPPSSVRTATGAGSARARRPRVAFVFYQFTPLQAARVATLTDDIEVIVIEVVRKARHYQWDRPVTAGTVRTVTLFDEQVSEQAEARAVRSALGEIGPDAVVTLGYARRFSQAAMEFTHAWGVPVVLVSDSTAFEASRNPLALFVKRAIVGAVAAGFVAGTPQRRTLAALGRRDFAIFEGYDVVDNDAIARQVAKARAADAVPAANGDKPFLCVARLVAQKNHATLLEAMARFVEAVPESRRQLLLAGYGPMEDAIRTRIADLGLSDRVVLLGGVPYAEMPALYARACALVLPSLTEPWGLVVNEAAAAGLPLALSNTTGAAEDLLREGDNGFSFPPRDVEAMAEALIRLDADAGLRCRMGKESERLVSDWTLSTYRGGCLAALDAAGEAKVGSARRLVARMVLLAMRLRRDRVRGFS